MLDPVCTRPTRIAPNAQQVRPLDLKLSNLAGLMTKEERRVYDEIHVTHGKWWVPAQWFSALAARARKEGRIKDDILLQALLDVSCLFSFYVDSP
ncbi:hypothetical protein AVEN_58091-1 [Araneus ventricosus]|uniref:Bestrophin homolog n=2 Tax=Araneus ventricosus TaxID=182803 RepID=A0A4Y2IGK6_ARAVE|nr:hypothetical protein AVEN_58091-1 [Araneus ventricosus]